MADRPDLTAELDAAEDIVTGRAEAIVTEWGYRDAAGSVTGFGVGAETFTLSVIHARERVGNHCALVRRTVTYGPWETTEASGG